MIRIYNADDFNCLFLSILTAVQFVAAVLTILMSIAFESDREALGRS